MAKAATSDRGSGDPARLFFRSEELRKDSDGFFDRKTPRLARPEFRHCILPGGPVAVIDLPRGQAIHSVEWWEARGVEAWRGGLRFVARSVLGTPSDHRRVMPSTRGSGSLLLEAIGQDLRFWLNGDEARDPRPAPRAPRDHVATQPVDDATIDMSLVAIESAIEANAMAA